MKDFKKKLLSVCTLVVFISLALGSAVNKIHMGAFNAGNKVEDKTDKRNYLEKNDGTRIYGEKVKWQSGLLAKDKISIDKQDFKISDIRGYRYNDLFYGRLKNEYIKRIVHGKLNVYIKYTNVSSTTTDRGGFTRTRSYVRTDHYTQKGDDGIMTAMAGQKDIKKAVSDCPQAVSMIDLSNRQIRKAIKKDPNYLNSVFDVYNNDCRPVN
jgi:hypothetical protein